MPTAQHHRARAGRVMPTMIMAARTPVHAVVGRGLQLIVDMDKLMAEKGAEFVDERLLQGWPIPEGKRQIAEAPFWLKCPSGDRI